jgi:hypothetical protein
MAFSKAARLLLLTQLPFLVDCHLKLNNSVPYSKAHFNSTLSKTSPPDQNNQTFLVNQSALAVLTHGSSIKKTISSPENLRL